jgi:thiamine-monophosphate kinase
MPLTELALLPGGEALTDDCGALPQAPAGEVLLVTTDLMEEGTHFRRDWHPPHLLGRKLLAVNLSDLDGSGARPLGFTLTLALPPDLEPAWLEAFLSGLAEGAEEAGIPVLGGDTVGRGTGIGLGLTAFGAARRWLRRDGLRVGDGLFVDQPLGASLRGLRKLQAGQRWNPNHPDADLQAHLDPRPNLGLGLRLAELPEVSAAMDLSDGLSRDLRMMAQASGLSIRLTPGLDPEALRGGEDYARCFGTALPRETLEARLGRPLIEVGVAIPRGPGPIVLYDGGEDRPLADLSFDHFTPGS